ncbi:MAG: PD-(D/E)XK nuclease family protein [Magnetococcales bacterium]|nr:PD-(D/E)XK nuclease family protein [Magnetococcales bacterium]
MSDQQVAENFINQIAIFLPTIHSIEQKMNRELGHQFCAFDLFNTTENYSSDVLQFLLNCRGAHGQGAVFLNIFLNHFVPMHSSPWPSDLNCAIVKREYQTNSGRRLDIQIQVNDVWIGIENKFLQATDQPKQISDYLEHLKSNAGQGKYSLIYLPQFAGEKPSSASMPNDQLPPELVLAGWVHNPDDSTMPPFPSIYAWLEECARHCKAANVRWFIEQFQLHVNNTIMTKGVGNMSGSSAIIELARKSPENLEVAILIGQSYVDLKKTIWQEFLIYLVNKLKQLAEELSSAHFISGNDYEVLDLLANGDRWCKNPSTKYLPIMLRRKNWPRSQGISISSDKINAEEVYIGFISPTKNIWNNDQTSTIYFGTLDNTQKKNLDETHNAIKTALKPKGGKVSEWWPYYTELTGPSKENLHNWNTLEALKCLNAKESLAMHVVNLFKDMHAHLPDDIK